jgi:hypothetical protein
MLELQGTTSKWKSEDIIQVQRRTSGREPSYHGVVWVRGADLADAGASPSHEGSSRDRMPELWIPDSRENLLGYGL